jgi:glycosyltransferase involved in cell wall biosynthesis
MTGMGEITPIGDHKALAEAIIRVFDNPAATRMPADAIINTFSPDQTAREYLKLFRDLSEGKKEDALTLEPEAYQKLYKIRDNVR